MARYNTVLPTTSISSNTSVTVPGAGQFTEFTGSTSAVTIPDPTVYYGQTQTFFNNTSGSITLTTPAGSFLGKGSSGSSIQTIVAGAAITLASDGASYVITAANGGGVAASTLTASSTVSLSPAALVSISPTGGLTIAPSSVTGTMDNVTIGGSTPAAGNFSSIGATSRGTGLFTTLGANSTVTLSPSNASVTISPSGTGNVVINPATAGTMDNISIGATTQAAGKFTTLSSSGLTTFTNGTQGSSATSGQSVLFSGGVGIAGTLYTVGLVETSSIAFKENISPITGALDAILNLTGVTYDRKDNKKHEAGLIAEHVYKFAPDLVALDEKGKPYGIHYTKISAYLIECVKTLQAEIDQLKGKKKTKGIK